MKRALAILLAVITVLLCACGSGATAPETTAAPTVPTTEATTEPTLSPDEILAEAEALLFPVDTAPDGKAALELALPLAEAGDLLAQYLVGHIYDYDDYTEYAVGVEQDYTEAVKWYTDAADQGYPRAMTALASLYQNGQGVDADEEKAQELAQQALDLGYAEANYILGSLHNAKGEYKEALACYEAGLEGSDPEFVRACYYEIGMLYFGGNVAKDEQKMIDCFQQAAELGDAAAMEAIGLCYQYGEGVEKDCQAATDWYAKAGASGHANAPYYLYRMRSEGYTPTAAATGTPPADSAYTYVNITMENWQEYFTVSEVTPVFNGNEFVRFDVTLSLNEAYRDRVASNGNAMSLLGKEIIVEMSYMECGYMVEVDAENRTVSRGGAQQSGGQKTGTVYLSDENFSFSNYSGDGFTACLIHGGHRLIRTVCSDGSSSTRDGGYTYPENIEITSISGTLPLLAE